MSSPAPNLSDVVAVDKREATLPAGAGQAELVGLVLELHAQLSSIRVALSRARVQIERLDARTARMERHQLRANTPASRLGGGQAGAGGCAAVARRLCHVRPQRLRLDIYIRTTRGRLLCSPSRPLSSSDNCRQ